MTVVLCDFTDLPADQCAHCTGATLEDPKPLASEGTWVQASYAGVCGHCEQRFPAGTEIVHTAQGWCHVECTRQAGTGLC